MSRNAWATYEKALADAVERAGATGWRWRVHKGSDGWWRVQRAGRRAK